MVMKSTGQAAAEKEGHYSPAVSNVGYLLVMLQPDRKFKAKPTFNQCKVFSVEAHSLQNEQSHHLK